MSRLTDEFIVAAPPLRSRTTSGTGSRSRRTARWASSSSRTCVLQDSFISAQTHADCKDAPPTQAILIVLITSFSSRPTFPRLAPLVMLLGSIAYALASETLVPASTLAFLQTLTIPLSLSSKVPQIVANQQARSTGQLSTFLVVNSLAGCVGLFLRTGLASRRHALY